MEDEPSADILDVRRETGKSEHEGGFLFRIGMQAHNCQGLTLTVAAYFYDEEEKPLKDANGEYETSSGEVCTWQEVEVSFEEATWKNFTLFIPYNELGFRSGSYNLKYRIKIFRKEEGTYHNLAETEFQAMTFQWKIEACGFVQNVKVDPDDDEGVRFTVDFRANDMKEKKGRIGVQVYYDRPGLPPVRKGGDQDSPVVWVFTEFAVKEEDQDFEGMALLVPRDALPLRVGRNRFQYKVWLQGPHDDEKFYALDATRAKQFRVQNGELKLPEVWVIEEIPIYLNWTPDEDGEEMNLLKKILLEMNRRIYDVFDGQVRVASFRIRFDGGGEHDHQKSAFRVYKDYKKCDQGKLSEAAENFRRQGRAFAGIGTPDKPVCTHLNWEDLLKRKIKYGAVFAHEFGHCWLGIKDEYVDTKDEKTGKITSQSACADTEEGRHAWSACMMAASHLTEFCRADNHPGDAGGKIHELDCYTRMKDLLKEKLNVDLVIPETPVDGPENPREPKFVIDK